jgi:hypothetical protein
MRKAYAGSQDTLSLGRRMRARSQCRHGSREELVDTEAMTFEATWSGLFMTIIEAASDGEPDELVREHRSH